MSTVTIRDVAREAGVSIATVSYVLNDTRRVSDDTRARVEAAVARLGYRANIMARNLQASETRLLGYTWRPTPPDQFNPILDHFLQAMTEAAARHGYRVLAFATASLEEELAVYEEMMRIGQVDGFVLSNTNLDDARIHRLVEANFPFVAFGRSNATWEYPWVDVDGALGVRLATDHLLARGHRRIACLAWPDPSLTGHYRLQGYLAGMAAAELAIEPAWVPRVENLHDDAQDATRRLLALPAERRPTAVIAMSDLMAIGAINAAVAAGLEIGRDLAVVGFDDAPIARYLRPPLTSLRQPIAEIGDRLVTLLIELCNGRLPAERHILLAPELIERASSAMTI